MGCGPSRTETTEIRGANGPLRKGTRVQTQWDDGPGHDNQWYVGTVIAVYTNGEATIDYDEPDEWTGEGRYIYALPPHHPGLNQKVTVSAPTMDGPPGMGAPAMGMMGGGVAVAAPVGPPVMGVPPPGYGAPVGGPMMGGGVGAGMDVMTVTATVPGGQTMQYMGPSGPMNVQVPMGVQPGQSFQFQVAASAPPVVMAQPVMAQPVYTTH